MRARSSRICPGQDFVTAIAVSCLTMGNQLFTGRRGAVTPKLAPTPGDCKLRHAAPLLLRHRFPPEIVRHAVWLYLRFTLSYRDVEELRPNVGSMSW